MYRYIKLKYSVLPGIFILNSHAQQLHVTSRVLLRRVLPKTTSTYQESEHFNDESDPSSLSQNNNTDFFGIESDDGVIEVSTSKNPTPDSLRKLRNREKFYSTSYGVVRYDSDNKVNHHGQYGKKFDFEFPHASHDYAAVSKHSQNLYADTSVGISEINNDNKNLDGNNELLMSKKNLEGDSYIDEIYFGAISEKDNTIQNNDIIQESSKELNYLDKNYFSTLSDSRILDSLQKSICEDEKKEIFTQRDNPNNEPDNINLSDLHELNSFNKINFENVTNTESSLMQNSSKERFQNDNATSSYPVRNTLGVTVDDIFSNNEDNIRIKPHSDVKPDYNLATEKNNDILKEFIKSNQLNMSSDIKYKSKQNEKLSSDNLNIIESSMQDSIIVPNTSIKKSRDKLSSKKLQENHDENINSGIKTVESLVRENNFKYSSIKNKETNEQESVEDKDISTAHDFVTKLRKEKETLQVTFRKEKDLTKIKFDSKGFRILKDQVANLSYFTRDEILNLLINNVVYSDKDLLVLNKPYGLIIHDSQTTKEPCLSTFLNDLAKEMDRNGNDPKLITVHRIDKETTGCLLLARNETMAQQLTSLFALRKIIKKYWIITTRVPDPPEGIIDIPISEGSINNKKRMVLHPKLSKDIEYKNHSKKGKEAMTVYRVLSESGNAALVEVMPKTGIKHQIRVHFGFGLSCPILGDHKYSNLDKLAPQKLQNDMLERLHVRQSKVRHIPMHIHARTVIVPKYFENRDLLVNIPLPEHMKQNLKMLKFRKRDMS